METIPLNKNQMELAKAAIGTVGAEGIAKSKELTKDLFKSEGVPWNRASLRAYILGVDFSLSNDTYEQRSGVHSIEEAKKAIPFTVQRQRAFLNMCILWAILDEWNREIQKHMSSVAI